MAALRVLAFAAATGRVGSVFLVGDKLVDWHISNKAAESGVEAAGHAQALINDLMPDAVVTEELETAYRGSAASGRVKRMRKSCTFPSSDFRAE